MQIRLICFISGKVNGENLKHKSIKSKQVKKLIILLLSLTIIGHSNAQSDSTKADSAMIYLTGAYKLYNPTKAFTLFMQRASSGEAKAMNAIGLMYAKGLGVDTNALLAKHWLQKSADSGYTKAWVNLGMVQKHHSTDSSGYAKAVGYFSNGLAANEPSAYFALGYMRYKGLGCSQSYTEALALFRQGIHVNRPDCMYFTGLCYKYGFSVPTNSDSATYYIDSAGKLGYHQANAELAAYADTSSHTGARSSIGGGRAKKISTIPTEDLPVAKQHFKTIPPTTRFTQIDGAFIGTLTQYDYSGKYVLETTPLGLTLSANGNALTGQWQQGKQPPIPIKAIQQGNELVFTQTSMDANNKYRSNKPQLLFKTSRLMVHQLADTVVLTGTLQLYNTYTRETEKPISFRLLQPKNTSNSRVKKEASIRIFPNPVNSRFNVAFAMAQAGMAKISIVDPSGRLVYTMVAPNLQAGKQLVTINKDLVAPGIYMLSIATSQKTETIAFVKE